MESMDVGMMDMPTQEYETTIRTMAGNAHGTEYEGAMQGIMSFLLPKRKCRIVIEYDPAAKVVRLYK